VSAWQLIAFVDFLLTILACVALFADACVLVHIVVTEGIVGASVRRRTVIDVLLAVIPGETGLAVAFVAVHPVYTRTSVLTWAALAVIDVDLANGSIPSLVAFALIAVDKVLAGHCIFARVGITLVDVYLTILSSITWLTLAHIFRNIVHTLAPILARIFLTVIWVDLAVGSLKTNGTGAGIRTYALFADPRILTWVISALVDVNLTGDPGVARMACAIEAIHGRRCVNTCSIILAWILWSAIVNVDFTVLTFVAIWAGALMQGN
jgi:hypothetical protein